MAVIGLSWSSKLTDRPKLTSTVSRPSSSRCCLSSVKLTVSVDEKKKTFTLKKSEEAFNAAKARTMPPATTTTSTRNHQHSAWHKFGKLLDASKGSNFSGILDLKNYMQRFGYLKDSNLSSGDSFDDQFQVAVTQYQQKLGLSVTGKLNSETISQMTMPRCGVRDTSPPPTIHEIRHYNYFNGKPRWSRAIPTTLTYAFSPNCMVANLNLSDIKLAFRRSFSRWSAVIPVNFTESEYYEFSDIKIGFYNGDHDDGQPFDGVLGVLAHGFSPESGKLHLDAAETWAMDFESEKSKVAIDLESVATHEIGHVLGLAHSFEKESVMYPSLRPREKKMDLKVDDIEGIQQLYGSNPNFNIEALSQSDTSSNHGIDSKIELRSSRWIITLAMLLIISIIVKA